MSKSPKSPKQSQPDCGKCRFYDKADETQGHCRRFPPVPVYAPVNPERPFVSMYPAVRAEMKACGEFKG